MKILTDEEICAITCLQETEMACARAIEAAVVKKLRSVDAIHEWYFEEGK